jgi:hypothetical protein
MSATSIASPTVSKHEIPSSDFKRKFFDTIGVENASSSESTSQDTTASKGWLNPRSQSVSISQENLKYDPSNDRFLQSRQSSGASNIRRVRSTRKAKSLTFNETVAVVPIPTRNEYSSRVRSRLWSSALELQENAVRNTIEFASEGYVPTAAASVVELCYLF